MCLASLCLSVNVKTWCMANGEYLWVWGAQKSPVTLSGDKTKPQISRLHNHQKYSRCTPFYKCWRASHIAIPKKQLGAQALSGSNALAPTHSEENNFFPKCVCTTVNPVLLATPLIKAASRLLT